MMYWDTEEFKAARSEDATLYARMCSLASSYPAHHTSEAGKAYYRDVVEPAKAEWMVARMRFNALRKAGEAAAVHNFAVDHNGEPVCKCGWDPAFQDPPARSRGDALRMVRTHAEAAS